MVGLEVMHTLRVALVGAILKLTGVVVLAALLLLPLFGNLYRR